MRSSTAPRSANVLSIITGFISCILVATSCGGGNDDGAETIPSTTNGGPDASAAPSVKPDRLTMTIDNPSDKGTYSLSGIVTLPAPAKAGVRAILAIRSGFGDEPPVFRTLEFANEFETTTLKGGSASIPFVVKSIGPGNYFLSVVVDQNGDFFAPGPGDFGGFYGGTTTKPIGHNEEPTLITVSDQPLTSLDFFIGPIACLASYGESCARDEDCRGTECTGESEIVNVRTGACFQNQCREAPSCPKASDKRAQGSCFKD